MVKVSIYNEGNYKIPISKVKDKLASFIAKHEPGDCSVSLAFVGLKKMDELVEKYYKGDPKNLYIHPILTFPTKETKGEFKQAGVPDLGEIIILYDEVDNEKTLMSLLEHGALHLLGSHH